MLLSRGDDARAKLDALDLSQAIIEFLPDGNILSANANFLDAVGYALHEVQGRHHGLFVAADERESAAYSAFWDALRCGTYRSAEFRRIGKGGREIWIRASYNPVRDRAGRIVKIVKIATDITARKAHSLDLDGQIAALRRSKAVIAFTPEGTILDANDNFLAALDTGSSAIAAAVEEQSTVTREMSGSMQTASHGAASIAAGVEAIAAAGGRAGRRLTRGVRYFRSRT